MKVFLRPPDGISRAMTRVANGLERHVPKGVEVVGTEPEADLVVLHVIGMKGLQEALARIKARGQRYAIIQYCLRTTEQASSIGWLPIWHDAALVWSYYDLNQLVGEDLDKLPRDEVRTAHAMTWERTKFVCSPLGVDTIFKPSGDPDVFTILTSGYVPEAECVLEANAAVRAVGGKQYHLGPGDRRYGREVTQALGVGDVHLAQAYSKSRFVSGLRRVEGFEMPAAEGLMCGARPIMFDAPHYRRWFSPWAIFIKEGTAEEVTDALTAIFRDETQKPVTDDERVAAAARFDWARIGTTFWDQLVERPRVVERKPRLLIVGDAVVATGFARATHAYADVCRESFDVTVLGLNYNGDPHGYPYPIYQCREYGAAPDYFGVARVPKLVRDLEIDLVLIQNDPWNFPAYLKTLKNEEVTVRVDGIVAVDGKNCRGYSLNGLRQAIFWTEFGAQEARKGGYDGPCAVVPLGVDLNIYHPRDQRQARREMLPGLDGAERGFIVGNVNRNQPRKRLDLTVEYFCEWVRTRQIDDAFLFLHAAPTGENCFDVRQLWRYYGGQKGHLILGEPEIGMGEPEHIVARRYACMDVLISTTQGEGMGLTALEAMACGVACVLPNWAAFGDWARDGALLVPCTSTAVTPNQINVIGGIADKAAMLAALDGLYYDRAALRSQAAEGLALARRPQFRWRAVGEAVRDLLLAPRLATSPEEVLA